MLGAPGAGKGTQGKSISQKLEIPHISTGSMFREMYESKNPLGVEAAEKYWLNGTLVPDDLTIKLVKETLSSEKCKRGFILDGFPRTIPQANALGGMTEIDHVIYLDVLNYILGDRLSSRRQCKKCDAIYGAANLPSGGICGCGGELYQRDDDSPQRISRRLNEYKVKTEPLVDYYMHRGKLRIISGEGDANTVLEDILHELG